MRFAILVAVREYIENASTKGFWIGLLLFPILVMVSFTVMRWLEEVTPTRHYVVIDRSGEFDDVLKEAMERRHARTVAGAFQEYLKKNSVQAETEAPDFESMSADAMERAQEKANELFETMLATLREGGIEALKQTTKAQLKEGAPEFVEPKRKFQRIGLPKGIDPNADLDSIVEGLKPYLAGEKTLDPVNEGDDRIELFAALIIDESYEKAIKRPEDLEMPMGGTQRQVQYWASNLADEDLKDTLASALNGEVRRREYLAKGMDAEVVKEVQRTELVIANLNPKKAAGKEEVSLADKIRQWAPVGFVYLLWIAIITISQMLLNNTIEEKSNRIIEVLLSSVTSGELMIGKLIGIAAIGLTMIGVWVVALVGILAFKSGQESELASQLFEVLKTSGLLPAFVIYFIFGYLLYSGIFLAIGSLCNTLKEAQNLMGPVMTIMMVPLLTMMFIPKDPNGTLATIMSWIPIYTPFVMMNRAAANPPMFDLVGTSILLVLTTIVVLWLSGRIFRVGILRTGQRPKLKELLSWTRAS